jgi:hypothetical protein
VKVNQNDFRMNFLEQGIGRAEGILQVSHEGPALQVDHRVAFPGGKNAFINSIAGNAGRVIRRPEQAPWPVMTRLCNRLHIFDNFALIPNMVARCDDMSAQIEEFLRDARGDAKSPGGVFPVDRHQAHFVFLDDVRKMLPDGPPPGLAEDVSYEKKSHTMPFIRGGLSQNDASMATNHRLPSGESATLEVTNVWSLVQLQPPVRVLGFEDGCQLPICYRRARAGPVG